MTPERIVFVCTGNTCRSPLAAALATTMFAERGLPIAATSAGLAARRGQPVEPQALAVASRRGLDLGAHRARSVQDVRDGPGTLWLTMTAGQVGELRRQLAESARIEALLPLARTSGAVLAGDDVPDPYRQDEAAYESVATTLERALAAIADGFAAGRTPAQARTKTVALPRLGGLRPTLESTTLKLLEEAGELAELIGKVRALSGERPVDPGTEVMTSIGKELLDVAQTAITMMFVLEEQHGVDLQGLLHQHVRKLAAKGYLEPGGDR